MKDIWEHGNNKRLDGIWYLRKEDKKLRMVAKTKGSQRGERKGEGRGKRQQN